MVSIIILSDSLINCRFKSFIKMYFETFSHIVGFLAPMKAVYIYMFMSRFEVLYFIKTLKIKKVYNYHKFPS